MSFGFVSCEILISEISAEDQHEAYNGGDKRAALGVGADEVDDLHNAVDLVVLGENKVTFADLLAVRRYYHLAYHVARLHRSF